MCDQDHFEDDLRKYSRRDLGALAALGIGASILFPNDAQAADAPVADAQDSELLEKEVTIKTPDGECDAYFVNPANHAHAAVLVWPDIFGLRPAFRQMAKRLAKSGYSVLVVNPFYRSQKAPTAPQGAGTPIQEVVPMARSLNAKTHQSDAAAFVAWLDSQEQVDKTKKIGTIGYCMGGPIVMRTAATVPDRIGAGCSFHGGGLVTKEPDSPHLLIPKMKASFLIAVAENDDQRDPESKKVLKGAFEQANLSAEIEVYAAGHGWCPPDTKVHNQEQADKAWARMLALFEKSLG